MTTRKTAAEKNQEAPQDAPQEEPKETAQEASQDAPQEDPDGIEKTPDALTVIVKAKFVDKHTGDLRRKGDVIEVTQERLGEILSAGNYVEKQGESHSG